MPTDREDFREEMKRLERDMWLIAKGHQVGHHALLRYLVGGPDAPDNPIAPTSPETIEVPLGYNIDPFVPMVPGETGIAFTLDGEVQTVMFGAVTQLEAMIREMTILKDVAIADIPLTKFEGSVIAKQATYQNRFIRFGLSIHTEGRQEYIGVTHLEFGHVRGRRSQPLALASQN